MRDFFSRPPCVGVTSVASVEAVTGVLADLNVDDWAVCGDEKKSLVTRDEGLDAVADFGEESRRWMSRKMSVLTSTTTASEAVPMAAITTGAQLLRCGTRGFMRPVRVTHAHRGADPSPHIPVSQPLRLGGVQ